MHCAINILALHMSRPCQGDEEKAMIPKTWWQVLECVLTLHSCGLLSITLKRSVQRTPSKGLHVHAEKVCKSLNVYPEKARKSLFIHAEKICMYMLKMSVKVGRYTLKRSGHHEKAYTP